MLKSKLFAIAALAAVVVVGMSSDAEALKHRYRSIPVWYGVYYPNCGPCGACIAPYVASGYYSGYGYCGVGCGAAVGCDSGYGCGRSGHVGLLRRIHAQHAWKRYTRGCGSCFASVGCYGGCGSTCDNGASCGAGCGAGCDNCNVGTSIGSGNEEILYDGPAADAPALPSAPADASTAVRRPLMMLASLRERHADGSADFERGLSAYRTGQMNEAVRDFELATSAEPGNALFQYHRALAMYDLYGPEAAVDALTLAVEAERREPISGWGKRMERVQGRARVWIEKARREAGLVR